MKRLIITLLVLFTAISSFAQPTQYPVSQNLGNANTLLNTNNGGLKANHILLSFADTTAANSVAHISFNDGSTIRVGDSIFLRSRGQWVLQTSTATNIPSLPDGLISVQGVGLSDTTVTISPNIVWRRDNINYTQTTSSVFQINKADSGYSRFDLIYIDSLNVIRLIEGVQDTVVVVPPAMPPHGIQVTIVSIIGDVVLTPTPSVSTNYWSPNGNNISSGTAYLGTLNSKTLDFIIAGLIRASLDTIGQMRFYLVNNGNYPHALTFYNNLDATLPSFNLAVNSSYGEISLSANNTGYLNALRIKKANGTDSIVGGAYSDMILQDYGKLKYNTTSSQTSAFEVIQGTTTPLFTVNSTTKPGVYIGSDTTYKPSSALTIPSTTQGILPPRMSTAQMIAINLPSNGLFLYNTDDSAYYYYKVNAWVKIATGSSSGGSSDTLFVVPPLYAFGANLDSLRGSWADTDSSGFLRSSDWNYFAVKPDSTVLNATGDTLLSYLGSTVIYSKAIAGGSSGWSLTGNAGTDPSANFVGSTDTSLVLRARNVGMLFLSGDGLYSMSMGRNAVSSNRRTIAIGESASAQDIDNIAIGTSSTANNGENSIAIGVSATTSDVNSISIGVAATSSLTNSIAIGSGAQANESYSMAIGYHAQSNIPYGIVLGDTTLAKIGIGTTIPQLSLHVVGDGTNTAAFMNGNVGIGTTTPTAKLQITATDSNILRLNPSGLWAVGATTDSLLSIDNSGRVHKRVIPTSGSGTVTSVATGYGLSGGTITTSGTLLVDSAALSLKYLRRGDSILNGGYTSLYQYNKGKDSLQTNINLKANIASPTFTGTLTADSIKPLSIIRFPQTAGAIAQSTAYISFDANSTSTSNGISWGSNKGIYSNASNALTIGTPVLNVSGVIVAYAMQATGAGSTSLSLSSTTATLGKSNADANTGVIISNSNASATGNIAAFSSSISGTSLTVSRSGLIGQYGTATAGGTTGAQTINKPTGTVNFAAGATSLVVTNSLVSTSTPIICVIQTNDLTMTSVQCVPGSGSFTIYSNAAATGETKVYFEVKAIN